MLIYIDISNYVETRGHTGIQRVVREVLYRLNTKLHSFQYKVIFFDKSIKKFKVIDFEELNYFLNNSKNHKFKKKFEQISIDYIKEGNLFFDMDGAWNNGLKRNYLYSKLKSNKVTIYNFIYDLVPIILPQYSHINTVRNFTTYIHAIYKYSDLVFFDSRSAEKDFLDIKDSIGNVRNISTRVVKLGSDISLLNTEVNNDLFSTKYILFVGTIEPRKEQALVLETFEKIYQKYNDINLVFIGRPGWNNDRLIEKIKNHSLLNKSIFWLENITDEELVSFYQNAYINVYLSNYEGFGLPILESLSYGNITITSKNSSMYEVGKNFADYLIYNTINELYDILELYIKNKDLYNLKKVFIKEKFHAYKWDNTYTSIIDVFENFNRNLTINTPEKLQFIFISIDFENLIGTIESIDKYIDFVSEYIIITKENMLDDFKKIVSKNKITIINENNILGKYSLDFSKRDHVSKNWLLRASILNLDNLENQFIMLDDDNRPLKKISIEHFIENGKYNAYYFFDLLHWNSFQSDYDFGQHNMKQMIDEEGLELLSYSSHKPQIIDKKIFTEVIDKYFQIGLEKAIDEWSIYFNYAVSKYPFLFNKKKYDTLNWPGNPSDWKQQYFPDQYNFENYYKTNFHGTIEEKLKNKESTEKAYLENDIIEYNNNKLYKKYDLVHGVFEFLKKKKKIYILNIPYFIIVKKFSWKKLLLNYKIINCKHNTIELMYYINGKEGAKTRLIVNNDFEDSTIEFPISCTSLSVGEHDLLIDCRIDNESVYGIKSPYLIKLFVE